VPPLLNCRTKLRSLTTASDGLGGCLSSSSGPHCTL
jgi:hypothetical protein